MRIAICDDEDQERLNIEALVKRYAPELSIVLFSSARRSCVNPNSFRLA